MKTAIDYDEPKKYNVKQNDKQYRGSPSEMHLVNLLLLASERCERAQSCSCLIEISDTYVYIYVYIYMWRYVKLYAHAWWYVMWAGLSVTTFISIVTTSNEH